MDKPILEILFEDEHYVIINKPAGLLVHKSDLDRRVKIVALQLLRDQLEQKVYPVHRLDRPASGILLFAKTTAAANLAVELFKERKINKHYVAIVRGWLDTPKSVDKPLTNDQGENLKEALTQFVLKQKFSLNLPLGKYSSQRYSLVSAFPKTGRFHQIRRHLNHIAHPIVGDGSHGDTRHNLLIKNNLGISGLMLHAHALSFIHPFTKLKISINCQYPSRFENLLTSLKTIAKVD